MIYTMEEINGYTLDELIDRGKRFIIATEHEVKSNKEESEAYENDNFKRRIEVRGGGMRRI